MNIREYRNNYLGFNVFIKDNIEIMDVLGQSVEFKDDGYIIEDDFTFWQLDKVFHYERNALDYIEELLNCRTKQEYNFLKWCEKDGLREGSIIQFEDGKQGSILGCEFADGCLKYSPIKKDGTIGKSKRNLYGNMSYKVIKY